MEPIGKATFVGDDDILYYDAESFLDCIREELPYRDTTGFRYEVLTDDPTVCKAVDDILLDFFSEDDPYTLSETSLDKGTQRKTTENELPSLTQCTA